MSIKPFDLDIKRRTLLKTGLALGVLQFASPAILKAAAEAGKGFRNDIRKNSDKAIDVMKEHGLIVHDITPEQYAQWEKLFQSVYPQISGTLIPADIMDMAIKYRDEYRAKKAAE